MSAANFYWLVLPLPIIALAAALQSRSVIRRDTNGPVIFNRIVIGLATLLLVADLLAAVFVSAGDRYLSRDSPEHPEIRLNR